MNVRKFLAVIVNHSAVTLAHAQLVFSYNDLDQVRNEVATSSMPLYGVNQRFEPAYSRLSGFIAEDVTFSGSYIDRIAVAIDFSYLSSMINWYSAIAGWNIYVGNITKLAIGGGLVAQVGLDSTIAGPGRVGLSYRMRTFEITGLRIPVQPGTIQWVAIQPMVKLAPYGQTFIGRSLDPLVGGGSNALGFNPGMGWNQGDVIRLRQNASISVNTAP